MSATRAHANGGLVHEALLYADADELLAFCVPFLQEGVEAGELAFCVLREDNLASLADALGEAAAEVRLCDSAGWYQRPGATLDGYRRTVEGAGRPVRVVGEVAWHDRSPAGLREWARYESILNLAFGGHDVQIVCPYDTRALPPEILDHAEATHTAARLGNGSVRPSRFVHPAGFAATLDAAPLEPPPQGVAALSVGSPGDARRFVESAAAMAGIAGERLHELVLAVGEIATNALVHGRPPVFVRAWSDGSRLLCEISDHGDGFDPVSQLVRAPDGTGEAGRGLWLAYLLCDLVEVRSAASGTTVRLHLFGARHLVHM